MRNREREWRSVGGGEYRSRENKKREERKRVTNGKGEKGEGKTIRG